MSNGTAQRKADYVLRQTPRSTAKESVKDPEKEAEAADRAEYAKVIGRPVGIADQAKFSEWRKKRKPSAAVQAEALGRKD